MTKVGRSYITLVNNAAPAAPAVTAEGNIALTDGFVVPAEDLVSSVYIAPAVGVAANRDITIGGTFAVGDVLKVTIISNAVSRQQWRKTYTHTVEVGFTALNDIAAAINALIDADGEQLDCPYTSEVVGPVITVTSKNDDTSSLEIESYTTSAAGTAVVSAKTFTASEGQPDDLRDKGADESLVTAANYDTVRIVYKPTVAQPFIDMEGKKSIEIFWFGADAGTAAGGSALDTLINS
jgi:hypothetical protein